MNGSRNGSQSDAGVVGNIAGFANDVATLAELQAKLVAMDLNECKSRAVIPIGIAAGSLAVVVGSIPVVLGGLGFLVADALRLSTGLALLIVGGAALVLGGVAAVVCASFISRSFESFRRSREEFERNLLWVKTVLTHSGRAAPRRRF